MKKDQKIIGAVLVITSFLLGFFIYHSAPLAGATSASRDSFSLISLATTTSVTSAGSEVISVLTGNTVYWEIDDSGANGVSCYPSATTTGYTYGGGWWLAPNGGVISMDGSAIYIGPVSCLTASGATSTIGIVAR